MANHCSCALPEYFIFFEAIAWTVSSWARITGDLSANIKSILSFGEGLTDGIRVLRVRHLLTQHVRLVVLERSRAILRFLQRNMIVWQTAMERFVFTIFTELRVRFVRPRPWRQEPLLHIMINVVNVKCLHLIPAHSKSIHIVLALASPREVLLERLAELTRYVVLIGRWEHLSFLFWGVIVAEPRRFLEGAALVAIRFGLPEEAWLLVE